MFEPSHGSQQLRIFRRLIRDGAGVQAAATEVGISEAEGLLVVEDDRRNPPPPEAYEPIEPRKEETMARPARKDPDDTGEIKSMDFEHAKKLYFKDIKPAKSEASSQGQAVSEAMKTIKNICHVEPQGARAAFKAFEMEDAHREIHLRSMAGMLNALLGFEAITCNFGDLVDQAEGKPDRYARPKLVTLPGGTPSDGTETDLGDAGEFTESSEEELAQQEGRGKPAPGTGAAAIAAMNETSAEAGQEA